MIKANKQNEFHKYPQNYLIKLTSDGQEKHQFQANTPRSMVINMYF